MVDEHNDKNYDRQHSRDCGDPCCEEECTDDMEVVELEDENGEVEEFVILEEVDFEDRHVAIMAPLAEVQAYSDKNSGCDDGCDANDLNIELFEVKDDDFTPLDDEVFAKRLLAHLDETSVKLEREEH